MGSIGSVRKSARSMTPRLSRTLGGVVKAIGFAAATAAIAVSAAPRASGVARTDAEIGEPVLTVREIPALVESSTRSAFGDALPDHLVTALGTRYDVDRKSRDGGLLSVHSVTIGSAGVARLRALVGAAGLDEHATAPPRDDAPGATNVETRYRHPTGRLVTTIVSDADLGVRSLLDELGKSAPSGTPLRPTRYVPTVLRLVGVAGTVPPGAEVGRWTLRSTALLSTTTRCVAVRGAEAERLRAELARVAARRLSAVAVDDRGFASVWMRSGSRNVALSVRIVLPGEPGCPPLAR